MSDTNHEPGALVVLLRALVMLVFLVGLPGVAVLKGSFPELCDELNERCHEVVAALAGEKSHARDADDTTDAENAAVHNSTQHDTQQAAPANSAPLPIETIQSTDPPAPLYADGGDASPGRLSQLPVGSLSSVDDSVMPSGMAAVGATAHPNAALPAGYNTSSGHAGQTPPDAAKRNVGPVEPLDPQRAEQMAHVLRDLGATYYRLEKWGADGQLFRFQCKMSVGGNPNVNRHFEATDANANRAIEQVVELVRNWRGSGVR